MSARITMIGGKHNGRTHRPRRPITLGEPTISEARFGLYGVIAALSLIAWSVA